MSMEDLVVRLRIEEDNRGSNKKGPHTSTEVKTKGRTLSWDLMEGSPRSKSS